MGSGTAEDPYRLAINLRTGRYTVQNVPKLELWDAICFPFNSRDQEEHWLLALLVDEKNFDAVCTAAETNWKPDQERGSETDDLSGGDEESTPRRTDPSARSSSTAVQPSGANDQSAKQMRKSRSSQSAGSSVSFSSETPTSRVNSAPTKGILKPTPSTTSEEESSDSEDDDKVSGLEYNPREA